MSVTGVKKFSAKDGFVVALITNGALFSSPETPGRPISTNKSVPTTKPLDALVPFRPNDAYVSVLKPALEVWLKLVATVNVTPSSMLLPEASKIVMVSSASAVAKPVVAEPVVKAIVPGSEF